MLWLALIHGANGMRTIVNDYTNPGRVQKVLKGALFAAAAVAHRARHARGLHLRPLPRSAPTPADLLPSFCPAA